jgi:hypothetical protein
MGIIRLMFAAIGYPVGCSKKVKCEYREKPEPESIVIHRGTLNPRKREKYPLWEMQDVVECGMKGR